MENVAPRNGRRRADDPPFFIVQGRNIINIDGSSSDSTPTLSLDEMVIRERGRRYFPLTWSPDIDLQCKPLKSTVRTPPKNTSRNLFPQDNQAVSSGSRKHRNDIFLTPDKADFNNMHITTPPKFKLTETIQDSPPAKIRKIDNSIPNELFKDSIETGLKGLSAVQLVNLIKTVASKHPGIVQDIRENMPLPDIRPLEERLNYLKSNIFNSLPKSRLSSKTDSAAYSRAATHLAAFRKCLIEQGKILVESQHWDSVIEYVLLAWSYVRGTPVWDNQPHNAHRNYCFKMLANFCLTALREGNLDQDALINIEDRLQGMTADSDEIQSCLKCIQVQRHVHENEV